MEAAMHELHIPLQEQTIAQLAVGDPVSLTGRLLTARDAAHKWMVDTFISKSREPEGDDRKVYDAIRPMLEGGVLYHCGPVVSGLEAGDYRIVAAGPTTSIREEPYEADVIHHFKLKAIIGKGGMGAKTAQACREEPAVYLHAIGGAATLIARSVRSVAGVYKLDFGVPEAMWVLDVQGFPAVVTMDAHGNSLHQEVQAQSAARLERLLGS
jgi:fumarate hydratase subunit beta